MFNAGRKIFWRIREIGDSMKNNIKRVNIPFILSLTITFIFHIIYLTKSTLNVPIMDYWKYINYFETDIFGNKINMLHLWKNDGIHRSPLQFIFFILNVKLFSWNTQIEIYLGAIVMAIYTILIYRFMVMELENKDVTFKSNILLILLPIAIFNINQYEMITLEFALSFGCRMLLFILSFYFTSKLLNAKDKKINSYMLLALLYIITICMVGGGYFPAFVVSIFFTIIAKFLIINKDGKKIYLKKYSVLVAGLVLGTILYMLGLDFGSSDVGGFAKINLKTIVELIKGFFIVLGTSIVGEQQSLKVCYIIGVILFVLYLIIIFKYIYRKLYDISCFPIILFLYVFGVIGLIELGRLGQFDLSYLRTSRYVCESGMGMVAAIYSLYIMYCYDISNLENRKKVNKRSIVALSLLLFFGVFYTKSYLLEYRTAPFRKEYDEELVKKINNIEKYKDDELNAFQADASFVRNGVEIMKKHKLGQFNNN